jgi:hypothetical protein
VNPNCRWDEKLFKNGRKEVTLEAAEPVSNVAVMIAA